MHPRITTGTAKNKKILVPDIPDIRVPQDIFKLALFSILGSKVEDSVCLDLFAGSGSLGLEALSQGAKWCDFVDEDKRAIFAINQNLKNMDFLEKAKVFHQNSIKYAAETNKKYDLIFVDPFYTDTKHRYLFKNLENLLADGGLIAFSHGKDLNILEQIEGTVLKLTTQRHFGASWLSILSK